MGILFNSTALGIHFCETSLIFNFKTRLGGEICLCDVNMNKGYCEGVFLEICIYIILIRTFYFYEYFTEVLCVVFIRFL